jgi:hypothetical protein
MKIQAGVSDNRFPELLNEIRIQLSYTLPFHSQVIDKERPSRQVHCHPDQSFIHRKIGMGESNNSLLIAKSLFQCQPETDADVLYGMMGVDAEISFAGDIQVEDPMLRK